MKLIPVPVELTTAFVEPALDALESDLAALVLKAVYQFWPVSRSSHLFGDS